MKLSNILMLTAFCGSIVIISNCKKDKKEPSVTYYGHAAPLGKGTAQSYVTYVSGKPAVIGIKFSADVLPDLPTDTTKEWEYPLDLPAEAKVTGFDHLAVDWNPIGHEPKQIYGLPHFDFHYYRITQDEQSAVVPGPDMVPVPAKYVPKDYASGVIAVPDMGVHWSDSLAPEFKGQKFTNTFIYGFYHGQMTFMEPMTTKEWLLTRADQTIGIKQPQAFQKSGYYPKVSHVWYDANAKYYYMALEGLQWADAN